MAAALTAAGAHPTVAVTPLPVVMVADGFTAEVRHIVAAHRMAEVRRTAADRMAVAADMVAATAVAADITGKTSLDFVPAQQGSIATLPQQWEAQTALLTALFLVLDLPDSHSPGRSRTERASVLLQPLHHIRLRQHPSVEISVSAPIARQDWRANKGDSLARRFPEGFPRLHLAGLYICQRDLHGFRG